MSDIPDVKFENFAAAKACLQTTLAPSGAVVRRLSIQRDQNGKAAWRVQLTSSDAFPMPDPANFVAVRAVLNRYVPKGAVLRTINLEEDESPIHSWRWEVCYGKQKTSRIRRAVNHLVNAIKEATPCLKATAETTQMKRHVERLEALERLKGKRRFYYDLRQSKKALRTQQASKQLVAASPSNVTSQVKPKDSTRTVEPKKKNQETITTHHSKSTITSTTDAHGYGRFVLKEVIPGTTSQASNSTNTLYKPNYDQWAIKNIVYGIKTINIELLTSLRLIVYCQCKTPAVYLSFGQHVEYAYAISIVKAASERINGSNIRAVYLELLQRSGYTDSFVRTFKISERITERVAINIQPHTSDVHIMCL